MAQVAVDQRELVVGHAFHQIAIVRHHDKRARPRIEQIFQHGEHIGVEVVARLVENEHIGFFQKNEQQLQTALLATRQIVDARIQMLRRKAQALEQLGGRGFLAVDHNAALMARKHLGHAIFAQLIQLVKTLREHGELHGFADFHKARARAQRPVEHRQQRGFARAVFAQNAVAVARPHMPVDMVEHRFVAELLGDVREFNYLLAQTLHSHGAQLERIAHGRLARDELLGERHVEFRLG